MSARILVVDDDPVAVNGLCALLQFDGFDAVGTEWPKLALETLKAERFDALISDLEMPEIHGLDLLRAAKAASPEMPVFIVTAYAGSPAAEAALKIGAHSILKKPLAYERLLETLQRMFPAS